MHSTCIDKCKCKLIENHMYLGRYYSSTPLTLPVQPLDALQRLENELCELISWISGPIIQVIQKLCRRICVHTINIHMCTYVCTYVCMYVCSTRKCILWLYWRYKFLNKTAIYNYHHLFCSYIHTHTHTEVVYKCAYVCTYVGEVGGWNIKKHTATSSTKVYKFPVQRTLSNTNQKRSILNAKLQETLAGIRQMII